MAGASAVLAVIALTLAGTTPANATFYNVWCMPSHCYRVRFSGPGSPFASTQLTANAAADSPGPSSLTNQTFVTSETWLINSSWSEWIEIGYFNGYAFGQYNRVEASSFVGYFDTVRNFHLIYGPELGVFGPQHSFLIGRGAATYSWRAIEDGVDLVDFSSVWWSGDSINTGGEIAAPPSTGPTYPWADTFNMYTNQQSTNGTWAPLGGTGASIDPDMNGISYSAGEWSWNTV
ncbi:hypothetical protein BH09ACT6_BH09ACT6_04520 [soil metagenome]